MVLRYNQSRNIESYKTFLSACKKFNKRVVVKRLTSENKQFLKSLGFTVLQ